MRTARYLLAATCTLLGTTQAVSNIVPVTSEVADECMITSVAPTLAFTYEATNPSGATASANVDVTCNLNTTPFLAYWDMSGMNTDGTYDLTSGGNSLKVMLDVDFDPTPNGAAPGGGSAYYYGVKVTAPAGQWNVPSGTYSRVVDLLVGW